MSFEFNIEVEQEDDGRWIAEIVALPGVMVYGKTKPDAIRSVQALALDLVAKRVSLAFNLNESADSSCC